MAANNPFAAVGPFHKSSPFGQATTGQPVPGPKSVFGTPSQQSPFAAVEKPLAATNPFASGSLRDSLSESLSDRDINNKVIFTCGPIAPTGFGLGVNTRSAFGIDPDDWSAFNDGASDFPPAKFGSVGGFRSAKSGSFGGKWNQPANGGGPASKEAALAPGTKNKKEKKSNDPRELVQNAQQQANEGSSRGGPRASQSARRKAQDKGGNGMRSKPAMSFRKGSIRQPTEATRKKSQFAFEFASRLYDHLRKNNISPPEWPVGIGNPKRRGYAEALKEAYKKYRDRAYASLRKAEIIDDPEKRRRLEDALDFKGICEDMCPEFEQVSRIAEYDVTMQEKVTKEDGTRWDEPALMVKKFGRSAAGQDAPLPMDVRSIDALRRTTDYLFDDLLQNDENLPVMHNFLWDRTRAVRRDFTFHSTKSNEEMKEMVYIYENITRFHAVAHHLLCRKGFGNEDFEPKQEIDQLGRTLLSLMEAYDACRDREVVCENEAEFRAYWLLLNAHEPSIISRIPSWGEHYWFDSSEIQTAWALINSMLDLRGHWGPIKPRMPRSLTTTCCQNFLEMVKGPEVSYTMACVAEVHFTYVRQGLLKNLVKAYSRQRDAPRYITARTANEILQFDTDDEAREFIEEHGLEFSTWYPQGKTPVTEPYVLLNDRKKYIPSPRVRPSFSGTLVERKRNGQSLSYLIHNTVYEEVEGGSDEKSSQSDDGLFVSQRSSDEETGSRNQADQVNGEAGETRDLTPQAKPLSPLSNGVLGAAQGSENLSSSSSNHIVPAATVFSSTSASPFSKPTGGVNSFAPSNLSLSPGTSPFTQQTTNALPNAFAKPSVPSPFPAVKDDSGAASTPKSFAGMANAEKQSITNTAFPQPSPPSIFAKAQDQSTTAAFSPAGLGPAVTDASTKPAVQFPPVAPAVSALGTMTATPQPTILSPAEKPAPWVTFSPSAPSAPSASSAPPAPSEPTASPVQAHAQASAPASNPTSGPATGLFAAQGSQSSGVSIPQKPLPDLSGAVQAPPLALPPISQSVPTGSSTVQPSGPAVFSSTSLGPSSGLSNLPASTEPANDGTQATQVVKQGDCMGDFSQWFVLGDGGLLAQFTEAVVQKLVGEAYQQHVAEMAEKERKEEEEQSIREARQHQIWNLRVKFFYRWRDKARRSAMKRILREGKKKAREFRERQRVLARQKEVDDQQVQRQAEAEARRKAQADGYRFSQLAQQGVERRLSAEQKLLASGIFSGFHDQRKAAQWVVDEHDDIGTMASSASPQPRPRPRRQGLSERSQAPRTLSLSMLGEKEGRKTKLLREKLLEERAASRRRSASGSSSFGGRHDSSPSAASGPQWVTNFSKKRRSGDTWADGENEVGSTAKYQALGVETRHWELRASGLVPTPDGHWVHEAIANRAEMRHHVVHDGDDDDDADLRATLLGADASAKAHTAVRKKYSPKSPKRKRDPIDDEEDWHLKRRAGPGSAAQRAPQDTEAMIAETQMKLRELNETMDRLDREERPWLHEQIQLLQNRQSMWDGQ